MLTQLRGRDRGALVAAVDGRSAVDPPVHDGPVRAVDAYAADAPALPVPAAPTARRHGTGPAVPPPPTLAADVRPDAVARAVTRARALLAGGPPS